MPLDVIVTKIVDPELLDAPDMVELFERTFRDPKFLVNAKNLLEHLKSEIGLVEPNVHLWVAYTEEHGLCGMGIVTAWTSPISPFPWIYHAASEVKEARRPLTAAVGEWLVSQGYRHALMHNLSHLNDRAFIGMMQEWASADVLGSLIKIELRR
jgi:hypothetical protein